MSQNSVRQTPNGVDPEIPGYPNLGLFRTYRNEPVKVCFANTDRFVPSSWIVHLDFNR